MDSDKIYNGNCIDVMQTFGSDSIDCIITSPPRTEKGMFIKGYQYSRNTQFKKGEHAYREKQNHWDKEWLYQKYWVERLSTPELAKLCGCTNANIRYWMVKHNIAARNVSEARKIKHWGLSGEANGMFGKKGKENPSWKGGVTPERQSFYMSEEWKNTAQVIFKRDNYKCTRCDQHHDKNNDLHIHHIVSFANKELRCEENNLILLCKKCHNWVHSNKNINKDFINV